MRLINPTDAELNAAFAEKVAEITVLVRPDWGCTLNYDHGDGIIRPLPLFTTSADAVLPWLEKHTWRGCSYRAPLNNHFYAEVEITASPSQQFRGISDKSLAKAAVIALLRARGVEVEFK